LTPTPGGDPVRDSYLGTDQATTGVVADVSTPANDPAMRDIAASGTQPISKPVELQAAQNPMAQETEIDVASQLDRAANGQDLNWRTSIVDLMKVVGMDASLQERRDLARELNYSGDTSDTASLVSLSTPLETITRFTARTHKPTAATHGRLSVA